MDTEQATVPYGYCECGCGRKTKIAARSDTRRNCVKGEPRRFLQGHSGNKGRVVDLAGAWLVDPDTGCWLWQRSIDRGGYGQMRGITAHRYVYQLHRGEITNGLHLDHLCRVRHCVNPAHMELVTNAENCRRGANAKLTKEQVRAMRERVELGETTVSEEAAAHGITYSHTWGIVHDRSWKGI